MTTITIFVRLPERADVRNVADIAKLDYVELVCLGVSCKPVEVVRVNDLYKYTFEVRTEPDKTPALPVWVVDGVGTGERLGG